MGKTKKQWAAETGIAVGILAVGLPVVLLLAPADSGRAAEGTRTLSATSPTTASPEQVVAPEVVQVGPPFAPGTVSALVVSGSSLAQPAVRAAADSLDWHTSVSTQASAGFTQSLSDQSVAIVEALAAVAPGTDPDVVVLQGGEADNAASPDELAGKVAEAVNFIRSRLSTEVRIIVIGPIPNPHEGQLPASFLAVNERLRQAAAANRVHYVDAVSEGWLTGDPQRLGQQFSAKLEQYDVRANAEG